MSSPNLLAICATSFAAVFLLLCVLAVVQRLILLIFPEKNETADAAMIAAMASVLQTAYPGSRISKVEEIK